MDRKEIDLHSEIIEILKIEKIINNNDSWGTYGPDIFIRGKGVIEIKSKDSQSKIKEAYDQIMQRKKCEWIPENLNYFCIITPAQIQIYHKKYWGYNACFEYDIKFEYPKELKQFIKLLKSDNTKVEIIPFLHQVLEDVYRNNIIEHLVIIKLLLNFNRKISFFKNGILVDQDLISERVIECNTATRDYAKQLHQKYKVDNLESIKDVLRHNWSHYQADYQKSSLGKYYTPKELVKLVEDFSYPYLINNQDTYVLDSCAGCGSFLEAFKEYNIIGRDIDKESINVLKELGYVNIEVDNSLINSTRQKYKLKNDDKLIIVGNPPYNDISSKNKRYGTNKKKNQNIKIDDKLASKDYGISFLNHYASLNPECIVILHPLSYLIKESNFNKLKQLNQNYELKDCFIFSSARFGEALKKNSTEFPIVCALYVPGKMSFNFIKHFNFKIVDLKQKLLINNIFTIDNYGIRKYPPLQTMDKKSNINLYHYNIRDSNSLKTSGNLSDYHILKDKEHQLKNFITIQFDNLYQYAYLNCYRRYFPLNFILGNISPICDKKLLNNQQFRDFCIMDMIIYNQHLKELNLLNKNSFIYTRFIINDFRRKMKKDILYEYFIKFVDYGTDVKDKYKDYFTKVFIKMHDDIFI